MALPARKLYDDYAPGYADEHERTRAAFRNRRTHDIRVVSGSESRDVAPGDEESIAEEFARSRSRRAPGALGERLRIAEESENDASEGIAGGMLGIDGSGEAAGETVESRNERYLARRLRERLEQKRQGILSTVLRAEQVAGDVKHHAYRRYRQAKRIIRIVRLTTLVGVSLGDIFFSLNIMALMVLGEWAYSKFINPNYLMFDPRDPLVFLDKFLFYLALAEIALAAVLIVILIIIVGFIYSGSSNLLQFYF